MFLDTVKLAMVEACRSVYENPNVAGPKPRSIDIEYPLQEFDWPAILVQFHPASIEWSGLNPDVYNAVISPTHSYESLRVGHFEGTYSLSIMALKAGERDRIYDHLIATVMMGDLNTDTSPFWTTLNNHDLIQMTFQPTRVVPINDSISQGTPWDDNILSYEASFSITVTGDFYADIFSQQLLAISEVEILPYREDEPVPGEGDDRGAWLG